MPTDVNIVSVDPELLKWLKLSIVVNLALGVAILTILTALAVVHFWRGG
jgi:hypothetical protein